jgi:hypothetical protein
MSPTKRTLDRLTELGFCSQVVERWNPYAKRRIDLFNFTDIVAIHADAGVYFIQACAGASHAARRTKILTEPKATIAAKAGIRIEVWSWAKQGARGERKVWTLRREDLTGELK